MLYSNIDDLYVCVCACACFAGKKGTVDLENDALVKVMKHQPSILQQMLATVLNTIMFEDCRNQWSMSRPLLPLILLNNEVKLQPFINQVLSVAGEQYTLLQSITGWWILSLFFSLVFWPAKTTNHQPTSTRQAGSNGTMVWEPHGRNWAQSSHQKQRQVRLPSSFANSVHGSGRDLN